MTPFADAGRRTVARLRALGDWLGQILSPEKGVVRLLVALILAGLGAALLTPGLATQDLPVNNEDVGQPAVGDIKATRDYEIPDLETTAQKRKAASAAEPTVYDYDTQAQAEVMARVRETFSRLREELAGLVAAEARRRSEEAATASGAGGAAPAAVPGRAPAGSDGPGDEVGPPPAPTVSPEVLATFLETSAATVGGLGVTVAQADLRALAEEGFSRRAEAALVATLQRALGRPIVADRQYLTAEAARGIVVRRVSAATVPAADDGAAGPAADERRVTDLSRLADVASVRADVERIAGDFVAPLAPGVRQALLHVARALVRPNLNLNRTETERRKEAAAAAIKTVVLPVRKGEMILRDGQRIEKHHLVILRGMAEKRDRLDLLQVLVGAALFAFLLLVLGYRAGRNSVRKFQTTGADLMMMAVVLLGFLVLLKAYGLLALGMRDRFGVVEAQTFYYLVPVAGATMVVRLLANAETAFLFAPVVSLLFGFFAEANLGMALYAFVGCVVGIDGVARASRRRTLLVAGLRVGLANVGVALGLVMFQGTLVSSEVLVVLLFALGSGLAAGVLVTGTAPILESLFGYTTDVQLLELANLNHPLLKELIVQAPGTYHHSIVVGSLVEAAAESIHSNPLLARVAAYYHDIGKIKMPMYFSENMRDSGNRHDKLAPSMSALIIVNHVKEGVELAQSHRLPAVIQDIIRQHHGQSLIRFFYQKAVDHEDEGAVDEKDFRYPGPKPQTREAALVMLADAVEATAKSIAEPTPARLTGLVQKTINRFFTDGQLEECELTLKDLHEIAKAFNRVLTGMYHHRVDYPEPATKERSERREREKEKTQDANADPGAAPAATDEVEVPADDDGEDLKRLGMS